MFNCTANHSRIEQVSFLTLVLASLVFSGCGNPTGNVIGIPVTLPAEGDVWKSWLTEFIVEWIPLSADSVYIEVYRNGERVGGISAWIENSGSYTHTEALPWPWISGNNYTIRVTDDKARTGESAEFTLDTDLDITSPGSGDIWYQSSGNYQVTWSPSPATAVCIELWQDGAKVGDIANGIFNIGYYVIEESLPDSFGTGSGYSLKLIDFLGYSGNSSEFTIAEATGPFGMVFSVIPPGSFNMGAPLGEQGSSDCERPVHTVTIDYTYQILITEVTQDMWTSVMGTNPSHFTGGGRPVENVTWDMCHDFTEALNVLDPEWEYRLPSEAEWEYACRSGTAYPYYWGLYMDGDYCWYWENSGSETHPVGDVLPGDWELWDMSGNVLEWCEDRWHENYEGAPENGSPWVTGSSSDRVFRGGCWNHGASFCRSAFRYGYGPEWALDYLGFRVVRVQQ